jgi:hypothetical protein
LYFAPSLKAKAEAYANKGEYVRLIDISDNMKFWKVIYSQKSGSHHRALNGLRRNQFMPLRQAKSHPYLNPARDGHGTMAMQCEKMMEAYVFDRATKP